MASSDGETENASDSLDETEDDRVFSKMTKENTEFNSDNANLLESKKNHHKIIKNKNEKKVLKPPENCILTVQNDVQKRDKQESTENSRHEISDKSTTHSEPKTDSKNINGNDNAEKDIKEDYADSNDTAISISEECNGKTVQSGRKNVKDSVNVVTESDKTSHVANPSEVTAFVKTTEAVDEGVEVKNNPEFINGATPLSCSVDSRNATESGKTVDAVMFSDGEQTWHENPSVAGNNEWQDSDTIPGQILQAINTSLTNRHKMREDADLCSSLKEENMEVLKENTSENEINKISVSVNSEVSDECFVTAGNFEKERDEQMAVIMDVEPRESFLHGIAAKPSAIYGPASDLFVSRSNSSSSSSSSSSDEQRKSQISLSINVIVNGDDSQKYSENDDDANERPTVSKEECVAVHLDTENKTKPEIPAKPTKHLSSVKQEPYDASHSSKIKIKDETLNPVIKRKCGNITEATYYSSIPDHTRMSISLVDPYAESNIYQEVNEKELQKMQDPEQVTKVSGRESKLAALAIELEQVRHTGNNTKRQAPAPPRIPDPPLEDPPNCTGRISPTADLPSNFSSFRGESMGFSSASSTTSTSSQDTETGYASWNLHGDPDDHPKYSKTKSSFLLTQYSKCKMLAMGYAEDGAKARKKFSIKKLLKIGKETEAPIASDPNNPNPKAWKYSDHFERPRAKLEIIHPMDLENKSVTVNPGFESLQSGSMSSFSTNADDTSFRNSISSDYGSFYSDTLSPGQEVKQEANYEYIQPHLPVMDEHEESKTGTNSSTSPTPSRSSTASQASTVTSGSSKNGTAPSHRPPKPPPPPRAHSLLPGNKVVKNLDGTFKFPIINGDASSSDEVTVTPTKPQAPRRQCKSAIIKSEFMTIDEQKSVQISDQDVICLSENTSLNTRQNGKQNEENGPNTSSVQIRQSENQVSYIKQEDTQSTDNSLVKDMSPIIPQNMDIKEDVSLIIPSSVEEGMYDNIVAENGTKIQTSITIKTGASSQKEKLSKSMLSRNKHPPLTKSPARPPPIYSKPQTGNFPKNIQPWKTLEDSYVVLTSSNRELLVKLVNQALKKRKNFTLNLNKFQFQWTDFEIDTSQPSSVFAFGEKIAYHATMPRYPQYTLTLVVSIQQHDRLQENSEMKYPVFGKFTDYIPGELLDSTVDSELESMPATILVLGRSNIATIECFSECLPEILAEENEKEVCFIILQLIQSLKSLQVQGIEAIDTNFQTLLLAKARNDKYHTLVFLYDICYDENDYSSDSCKISLCQYTLMLLFQMLRVQSVDDALSSPKFSSIMSKKVFETAFSLLLEEKAVSLSQTKTLFECYLWGVTKVLESLQNSDDCDGILHRWLDIERSNCIKSIVNDEELSDITVHNEYYSHFLIRTNVRNIREVASYL